MTELSRRVFLAASAAGFGLAAMPYRSLAQTAPPFR